MTVVTVILSFSIEYIISFNNDVLGGKCKMPAPMNGNYNRETAVIYATLCWEEILAIITLMVRVVIKNKLCITMYLCGTGIMNYTLPMVGFIKLDSMTNAIPATLYKF